MHHQENQLISVILATYNGSQSLQAAVQSILQQSYQNLELIVVDDASTEQNTASQLKDIAKQDSRIKLIQNSTNVGVAAARNIALQQARGEFVALMDDDDTSDQQRLQIQLDFMHNNPDCAAVSCQHQAITASPTINTDKITSTIRGPDNHADLSSLLKCLVNSTSLIRTKALQEMQGWRELFRSAEDQDLTLRLEEKYQIARVNQTLYRTGSIPRSDNQQAAHHNAWRYRLASMLSAIYRRSKQPDLIEQATDVDQMLRLAQRQPAQQCQQYLWRCLSGDARRYMKQKKYQQIDQQLQTLRQVSNQKACKPLITRLYQFAITTKRPGWFIHRLATANKEQ